MKDNNTRLRLDITKSILKSYNTDLWGVHATKRKFGKTLQKILVNFENNLRRTWIYELKPEFMRFPFFIFRNSRFKTPPKNLIIKSNPTNFFFFLFKNYFAYKVRTTKKSKLITNWVINHINRIKRNLPRRLYFLNKAQYFSVGQRLPRIQAPNYIRFKRVQFYKLKTFYCFKKVSTLRRFLQNIEYRQSQWNYKWGLSSTLVHMFFRTNLFPTMKFCYALINIGGAQINGKIVTSPFKSVNLYDTISITPAYIKYFFKYFLKRVKNRLLLTNIPNFFDYDYQTMRFCVWRELTTSEQYFWYEYPFQRPTEIDGQQLDLGPRTYRKKILKR